MLEEIGEKEILDEAATECHGEDANGGMELGNSQSHSRRNVSCWASACEEKNQDG